METNEINEVVVKKPHTLRLAIIITVSVLLVFLAGFMAYYYGLVRPKVLASFGYNPNDPITMTATPDYDKGKLLDSVTIDKFKKISGVSIVSPLLAYSAQAQFTSEDKQNDTIVYGVTPNYLRLENISIAYGKSTFTSDNAAEAIVSLHTIKALSKDEPQSSIGKIFSFTLIDIDKDGNLAGKKEISLKVIGISEDEYPSFVYAPINVVNVFNTKSYNKVKIEASNLKNLTAARKEVEAMGFRTLSSADTYNMILDELKYPWTYYLVKFQYPGWLAPDRLNSKY